MAARTTSKSFNIVAVIQNGRLQYEAMLLAASLRDSCPEFAGRLIFLEPQKNALWGRDPSVSDPEILHVLSRLGAEIIPFENEVFGENYPHGNKIEGLKAAPAGEPFLFLDTDTLVTGDLSKVPFDFERPTASLKREGTWPKIELYGPGYGDIWRSLYEKFSLDYESSLDLEQPDEYWQRYLYFNAGFTYFHCPREFGARYLRYAREIRDAPPEALVCQEMKPWLDQIALPLVIHSFGGGRAPEVSSMMDHEVTCHYRLLPLLYARESDETVALLDRISAPNWIKKVLKKYEPFRKMIYQGKGQAVRDMFDRENLPRREQALRNQIKRANLWMR